jgi:D-arginine dehydrogenase
VSGKRRVVVIGGGIAGVSIAGELSHDHDVVLLEAEETLAHHTTGRSAAVLLPGYGNKVVRELTQRSIALYAERSKKYEVGLLEPRAFLQIAGADRADMLREIVEKTPTMHMIDIEDAFAMCPYLQRDAVAAAAIDETGSAIDVASLHQTYVREIAANGGVIVKTNALMRLHLEILVWCLQEKNHGNVIL